MEYLKGWINKKQGSVLCHFLSLQCLTHPSLRVFFMTRALDRLLDTYFFKDLPSLLPSSCWLSILQVSSVSVSWIFILINFFSKRRYFTFQVQFVSFFFVFMNVWVLFYKKSLSKPKITKIPPSPPLSPLWDRASCSELYVAETVFELLILLSAAPK